MQLNNTCWQGRCALREELFGLVLVRNLCFVTLDQLSIIYQEHPDLIRALYVTNNKPHMSSISFSVPVKLLKSLMYEL